MSTICLRRSFQLGILGDYLRVELIESRFLGLFALLYGDDRSAESVFASVVVAGDHTVIDLVDLIEEEAICFLIAERFVLIILVFRDDSLICYHVAIGRFDPPTCGIVVQSAVLNKLLCGFLVLAVFIDGKERAAAKEAAYALAYAELAGVVFRVVTNDKSGIT